MERMHQVLSCGDDADWVHSFVRSDFGIIGGPIIGLISILLGIFFQNICPKAPNSGAAGADMV